VSAAAFPSKKQLTALKKSQAFLAGYLYVYTSHMQIVLLFAMLLVCIALFTSSPSPMQQAGALFVANKVSGLAIRLLMIWAQGGPLDKDREKTDRNALYENACMVLRFSVTAILNPLIICIANAAVIALNAPTNSSSPDDSDRQMERLV